MVKHSRKIGDDQPECRRSAHVGLFATVVKKLVIRSSADATRLDISGYGSWLACHSVFSAVSVPLGNSRAADDMSAKTFK